jgi:hypothetical protein
MVFAAPAKMPRPPSSWTASLALLVLLVSSALPEASGGGGSGLNWGEEQPLQVVVVSDGEEDEGFSSWPEEEDEISSSRSATLPMNIIEAECTFI